MLTPPDGLTEQMLATALCRGWKVGPVSMTYLPVGFGSHHWEAVDGDGARWFLTVDDLATKRLSPGEPATAALERLRASLAAATNLREHGRRFVVAPVPTLDGGPLARVGDRFAVALYEYVEGRSFSWGEFSTPEHRRAVLDLIIAVHTAPRVARRHAMADHFAIPHRDELAAALQPAAETANCGPYAGPARALLAEHAARVRRLLARYDRLVAESLARPSRVVLTHGEPHPGNTMRTSRGWLLIDWDTVLVAPPERDLWMLDPGDGSILDAYAEATGVVALPAMRELCRARWDLADIAVEVSRFRRQHLGSLEDDQAWDILRRLVTSAGGFAGIDVEAKSLVSERLTQLACRVMSSSATGRARPLPAQERRAALVAATLPLLVRCGTRVTTRQIAQAAGVAEGTIFRVFRDKDELVQAAIATVFDPTPALIELDRVDSGLPLWPRLLAVTTVLQRRMLSVFNLVIALRLTAPPAEIAEQRRAAGPARARILARIAELLEPDRDRFRQPVGEVVRRLWLLTFAGSHPMVTDASPLTATEIVDLFLNGVARTADAGSGRNTGKPGQRRC